MWVGVPKTYAFFSPKTICFQIPLPQMLLLHTVLLFLGLASVGQMAPSKGLDMAKDYWLPTPIYRL